MTEAEARARLTLFACANDQPALASEELDILLQMARVLDKNGLRPTDTGWEPSFNVNYAVSQAWLLKASRLADRYLFMSGGKMLSRNQFYDHCMRQAKVYAAKAGIRSLRLSYAVDTLDLVPANYP